MAERLSGYTPAEAALYRAERLRTGEAVEFPLAPDERLVVRLLPDHGQPRSTPGDLHVKEDEDAFIVSALSDWRLGVTLTRANDSRAPLKLSLPGVALIVLGAALCASKPDAKSVTIHSGAPTP